MPNELTDRIPFRENMKKIKAILCYIHRTDRSYFAAAAAANMTNALASAATIVLSANILRLLYGSAPPEAMVRPVVLLLAAPFLLHVLASVLHNEFLEPKMENIARIYDGEHASKYQRMDYSLLESPYVKKISDRIATANNWGCGIYDIFYRINEIIWGVCSLLCSGVVAFPVLRIMIQSNNPRMYLGLAGLTAVMILLAAAGVRANRSYQERLLRNEWEGLSGELQKKLVTFNWYWVNRCTAGDYHFIKDVHLYNGCEMMKKYTLDSVREFDAVVGRSRDLGKKAGRVGALRGCAGGFTGLAGYVISAAFALLGAFDVSDVIKFAGSVTGILACFQNIGIQYGDISLAARRAAVTLDLLQVGDEMYKGRLPVEKRLDNRYEIEFKNVSFRYPGREEYALRNFSLKLRIGERMAIVGRNGSGKTTMIKLLCRLYDPQEGEILLNGVDIRKFRQDEYIKLFSVVFQDFGLFSLPLGQNVAASMEADEAAVRKCLEKAGFKTEQFPQGLDTYLYQDIADDGVEISGGEAQKIAIARALYKDAPFVLLDEPTASLDPISEYEIYSGFDAMVGDKTAIYISHRLSSCRFCDDIAVFYKGRLVQRGSHQELLKDKDGEYYELWHAQAQYYT